MSKPFVYEKFAVPYPLRNFFPCAAANHFVVAGADNQRWAGYAIQLVMRIMADAGVCLDDKPPKIFWPAYPRKQGVKRPILF